MLWRRGPFCVLGSNCKVVSSTLDNLAVMADTAFIKQANPMEEPQMKAADFRATMSNQPATFHAAFPDVADWLALNDRDLQNKLDMSDASFRLRQALCHYDDAAGNAAAADLRAACDRSTDSPRAARRLYTKKLEAAFRSLDRAPRQDFES